MQRGQALLELLIAIPFLMLIAMSLSAFSTVVTTTFWANDGLKDALWFSDHSVDRLTESVIRPTHLQTRLLPEMVERTGQLLRHDGFLTSGQAFQDRITEDNTILGEIGLELTQASVELIRRMGSPLPFREVRPSAIYAVGIVGARDMPLPQRINVYD